jgi:hypothetical protein
MPSSDKAPINPYDETSRLVMGFATMAHGYENSQVISALLQFCSSLLVTQITPAHIGVMVDKFCADLTELVAKKQADIRASYARTLEKERAKGKAKAKKARAVRHKAASRN